MKHLPRQAIFVGAGLVLAAGCVWLWFATMEQRWTARPQTSAAARENPMLGATRLLDSHRHPVRILNTLTEALLTATPDGTLLLAENSGIVTREQGAQLLTWVRRGNTLIVRPKWSDRTRYLPCGQQADDKPETGPGNGATETDPIGAYLGVELVEMIRRRSEKPEPAAAAPPPDAAETSAPCLAKLTLPDTGYALQLEIDQAALKSSGGGALPLFSDATREALRVYAEGAGHIAVVAGNYFDNRHLARYDHAELLLALARLNRNANPIVIVQHLDMPPWYQALWWHFQLGIVSLGCGLLLLLWLGLRRFGPLLPEPDQQRRALLEHIDASGRWLWQAPGGRDVLLAAARAATNAALLRQAPELLRMAPDEQAAHLARTCRLPPAQVASALLAPASSLPFGFTRQIQTLQLLRKHYER